MRACVRACVCVCVCVCEYVCVCVCVSVMYTRLGEVSSLVTIAFDAVRW